MDGAMKRHFPLQAPGKDDARVRDKIRHELNKIVRRAREQPATKGFKGWDFTCKVGADEATAEPRALKEVAAAIDAVALTGATNVFVEIIAVPALPLPPPRLAPTGGDGSAGQAAAAVE